jgi:hypothetical protein
MRALQQTNNNNGNGGGEFFFSFFALPVLKIGQTTDVKRTYLAFTFLDYFWTLGLKVDFSNTHLKSS